MDHILMTHKLTKVYGSGEADRAGFPALQSVDLTVWPGEFISIMGPSGCGKSTLLHLLGGLDRPTSGEVYLADRRLDTLSEAQRAILRREKIGFVFQFFNLIGNLTVADNIELPCLLAGHSTREARNRRVALLEELGISDQANAVPSRLSGGQQQRVALARALINRPDVLLADEPTGNLDSQSTKDVLAMLRRFQAGGQTIVLVTHDARVASITDRVITMRDGRTSGETQLDSAGDMRGMLSQFIKLEA